MAALVDTGLPTLVNVTRRLTPEGSVETKIAEILATKKPILDDIPWKQGNLPTGHRVTLRSALPSPKWRKFNQGIDPGKSDTEQFDEACGMLEDMSKVDVDLATLNGDHAAYRATEDKAFIEGFGQKVGTALFYESGASPTFGDIFGLTPRYAAATGMVASSYVQGIGTRTTTGNHSIWLVTWEEGKIYGIYPKNSMAGMQHKDYGEQLTQDSAARTFRAYVTWFKWDWGLCVEDYRYAVRLQWDADDAGNVDTALTIPNGIQDALEIIQDVTPNTVIYMDRTTKRKFNAQLMNNSAGQLEYLEKGGRRLQSYMGVPIRTEDSLVSESAF